MSLLAVFALFLNNQPAFSIENAKPFSTFTRVTYHTPFHDDFHLMQKALEGDESAVRALVDEYAADLKDFLKGSGATVAETHEVVDSLWADGLVGHPGRTPPFQRYSGQASLRTWMKTVALNKLLDFKRSSERRKRILVPAPAPDADGEEKPIENMAAPGGDVDATEAPLLKLIRDAVEVGFQTCEAEQFVLLQLYFREGLFQDELARMWKCHMSTISRSIEEARKDVREATLRYIQSVDPWLELQWEDFVEMCNVAGPALFDSDGS